MTIYELGNRPVGLRRGRVTLAAYLAGEPVRFQFRTSDPSVPLDGLWTQHGTGYVGMFNRPVTHLPKEVTVAVARADGSAFPAHPPLQVTASIANDSITWTVAGLGGMPTSDIVTLSVADEWLTFTRSVSGHDQDEKLPPRAAKMAAAARGVLGVASVPDPQRAHVVVVVDPSGSMKTARARRSADDAAQALVGIHAVLGGSTKRLDWHLATVPPRRFESSEALFAALEETPYHLGTSLDLPSIANATKNELTVVYLITDDLPGQLAEFADVAMQARHLVVVANPASAPAAVGPVDISVWPGEIADDDQLPALAKDLLRGCFDADSGCGRAVSA